MPNAELPSNGYKVKIKQFEGPLDLLLYLIEKAELDIRDVFVAEITSEFLSYLSEIDQLDMNQASEFVAVAATLVYMKSRSLIPKPQTDTIYDEADDTGEQLIQRLREYRMFKRASQSMQQLFGNASAMLYRTPMEFPLPPKEIILKNTTVEGLYNALLSALHRLPTEPTPEQLHNIHADQYTVRSCTHMIRKELQSCGGKLLFLELVSRRSKLEIIVIFMALLEMLHRGEIALSQQNPFEDIGINEAQLLTDDIDIAYDDEIE